MARNSHVHRTKRLCCGSLNEASSLQRSLTIGITSDKISGKAKELPGKARHAVGDAVGNKEIDAKGVIQEAKGDAQRARGNAKEAIKKVLIARK
jgi:uncharacterized protein YjbJ (UPF0337 family)